MRFASLGSGSKGNATLVEYNDHCIMIDCGFSIKDCVKRLQRLGKTAEDINAILVTHEHSDHWKGVLPFAERYSIDVYATAGCLKGAKSALSTYKGIQLIDSHKSFKIDKIDVVPVPVPHDAREPVQYILSTTKHRLGILTDIGSLTPYVIEKYRECDALVVEANHDLNLLYAGDYPKFLKDRVASKWGHLNNAQTASLIQSINQQRLQHLVVAHISQSNNDLTIVKNEIEKVFQRQQVIHYATQNSGFDWLLIE
jgi:phosphoribosyl 1,2-cyclic phosphodiesterase